MLEDRILNIHISDFLKDEKTKEKIYKFYLVSKSLTYGYCLHSAQFLRLRSLLFTDTCYLILISLIHAYCVNLDDRYIDIKKYTIDRSGIGNFMGFKIEYSSVFEINKNTLLAYVKNMSLPNQDVAYSFYLTFLCPII